MHQVVGYRRDTAYIDQSNKVKAAAVVGRVTHSGTPQEGHGEWTLCQGCLEMMLVPVGTMQ